MIQHEVLKTVPKMASWGDMHEELKTKELNPMSKVEECIILLNKEMGATMVINKEKKLKIK